MPLGTKFVVHICAYSTYWPVEQFRTTTLRTQLPGRSLPQSFLCEPRDSAAMRRATLELGPSFEDMDLGAVDVAEMQWPRRG